MTWTTPEDLRTQVVKLWDRGVLLAELAYGESTFPRRLSLKGPTSSQMTDQFDQVRQWISQLQAKAGYYRLVWRDINHRLLGSNQVPVQAWIDSVDDAFKLIRRYQDAQKFHSLAALTKERRPELIPWLQKRPLRALDLVDDWPRLLDIVDWLAGRPRPRIYLRQVDVAGVHTKFIETHRGVLAELFDLVLPQGAIDISMPRGAAGFCQRYGFRDKPLRVRFRLLDPNIAFFATDTDQDITVTSDTFARLDPTVCKVFITENEINFLAFPNMPQSMVIFGAGYNFDILAQAAWLHDRQLIYWGDIDTHGFAILDQLRAYFPEVVSFLMDRETLMAHQDLWGTEPKPEMRDLDRLKSEEEALYNDLRENRLGDKIRLEQEHIGFEWVLDRIEK